MGVISGRVYVIIALVIFAVLFAIQFFGGSVEVASFLKSVRGVAASGGLGFTVANFIIGPMIWTFETYIYGPAAAALLWPLVLIELFLFIIVWMFSLVAPSFKEIPGA